MRVTPIELPSAGHNKHAEDIEIPSLNYLQLVDYSKKYPNCKDELSKFLLDYNLVKSLIPNWKTISLMDLEFVIFIMKKSSISKISEFTIDKVCTHCNSNNIIYCNSDELQMPTYINYELVGEVVLNSITYKFEVPTLEVFDKVLNKVTRVDKNISLSAIYMISTFPDFSTKPNEIESLVTKATSEDALQLLELEMLYYNSKVELNKKCINCKEEVQSISLRSLIDNVFRCLLLNRGASTIKIRTE